MSSVQHGLPRTRSFDSLPAPSTLQRITSPRSPAPTNASFTQPWPPLNHTLPLTVSSSTPAPGSATHAIYSGSPAAATAATAAATAYKPVTLAVDAEALVRTDGPLPWRPTPVMGMFKKLFKLNELGLPKTPPIKVVLLCHASGDARVQLLEALHQAQFPYDQVFSTRSQSLHSDLKPTEAMLYLSCDPTRVRNAVREGIAAGCFEPRDEDIQAEAAHASTVFTVAFDFDGVLADDLSQQRFDAEGLEAFQSYEHASRDTPMGPGSAQPLAMAMVKLRDHLAQLRHAGMPPPLELRIAVVTARGAGAVPRLYRTLAAWNLEADKVLCLSGADKTPHLIALKADLFLDDSARHVAQAKNATHAVHMPTRASLQS